MAMRGILLLFLPFVNLYLTCPSGRSLVRPAFFTQHSLLRQTITLKTDNRSNTWNCHQHALNTIEVSELSGQMVAEKDQVNHLTSARRRANMDSIIAGLKSCGILLDVKDSEIDNRLTKINILHYES